MNNLTQDTVEGSELVEQTFAFWFKDSGHIRTPFPDYIRPELKKKATDRFFNWVDNLNKEAKDELNDEMIGEKFEEIIFETASNLVKTEDERITILYPFLPRLGDNILDPEGNNGEITDRSIQKDGDTTYLEVKTKGEDGKEWKTRFELPV